MEAAGTIAIALVGLGFAGVAIAFGIRIGSLRAANAKLGFSLYTSEDEHKETREEFEAYQKRARAQIDILGDRLTDAEDMLSACTDPAVIHELFDRVLSEASSGLGDSGSD